MLTYNKKNLIAIISVGFILVIMSLFLPNKNKANRENASVKPVSETNNADARLNTQYDRDTILVDDALQPTQPETICIHVVGMVFKPGVYDMKPGSRIKDAIKQAGGSKPNADLESINLAEKLEDGVQIYIAKKGEIPKPTVSTVTGGSRSYESKSAKSSNSKSEKTREPGIVKLRKPSDGKVCINTAGLNELQKLPGIGPSTAQKILDYRLQNGRFNSIDELDEVKGIGPSKLSKIRPFVIL